jgi:hypothetical protein
MPGCDFADDPSTEHENANDEDDAHNHSHHRTHFVGKFVLKRHDDAGAYRRPHHCPHAAEQRHEYDCLAVGPVYGELVSDPESRLEGFCHPNVRCRADDKASFARPKSAWAPALKHTLAGNSVGRIREFRREAGAPPI